MLSKNSYMKHFFNSLFLIFLINIFVTGLLYYFLVTQAKEHMYTDNINNAKYSFSRTNEFIRRHIEHYKDNINSLEKSFSFKDYLQSGKKENLIENMKIIINSNKPIFQIRFLDKNGFEKIRIDRDNSGKVFIVDQLQNKSKRYYFTKTASLEKGEFYISNLDLNIENGEIEIPYKPTIRISKPVFKDGEFQGILILNYFAQEIIDNIKNLKRFDVYFMDKNSNFFLHPDPEKNFSSQLGKNHKVVDDIPDIFKIIKNDNIDKKHIYYVNKVTQTDDSFFYYIFFKRSYLQ